MNTPPTLDALTTVPSTTVSYNTVESQSRVSIPDHIRTSSQSGQPQSLKHQDQSSPMFQINSTSKKINQPVANPSLSSVHRTTNSAPPVQRLTLPHSNLSTPSSTQHAVLQQVKQRQNSGQPLQPNRHPQILATPRFPKRVISPVVQSQIIRVGGNTSQSQVITVPSKPRIPASPQVFSNPLGSGFNRKPTSATTLTNPSNPLRTPVVQRGRRLSSVSVAGHTHSSSIPLVVDPTQILETSVNDSDQMLVVDGNGTLVSENVTNEIIVEEGINLESSSNKENGDILQGLIQAAGIYPDGMYQLLDIDIIYIGILWIFQYSL